MVYGYVRVSTKEQCLDRQVQALNDYTKIDRLFQDKQSGKNFEREQYQLMKSIVVSGDTVIVQELDRLGRNKNDVKKELEWFKEHGVNVRILELPTTLIDYQGQDWIGDMVNNILIEVLGAIAEQERNKMQQRQMEGYAAKKQRGDWDDMGRPKKTIDNIIEYKRMIDTGQATIADVCRTLGISRNTWKARVMEVMIDRKSVV